MAVYQRDQQMREDLSQDNNSNQSASGAAGRSSSISIDDPLIEPDFTEQHKQQLFAQSHQVISISGKKSSKSSSSTSSASNQPNVRLNFSNLNTLNPKASHKKLGHDNLAFRMKNSPKSSSDAEVFVDVESVDERGGTAAAIILNRGREFVEERLIEDEIEGDEYQEMATKGDVVDEEMYYEEFNEQEDNNNEFNNEYQDDEQY